MKRFPALITAACLAMSLCACGAPGGDRAGSPAVSVAMQTLGQDCKSGDAANVVLLHFADDVPSVTISGGEDAQKAINDTLQAVSAAFSSGSDDKSGLDACLAQAKAEYKKSPDRFLSGARCTMERRVTVSRGDESILSFVYTAKTETGDGAKASVSSVNFSTATGAKLAIGDISSDPETLKSYCTSFITDLSHSDAYSAVDFTDGYESKLGDIVVGGCWYFSGDGLVFSASPGEIAGESAGIVSFTVPYEKLASLIKPACALPANRTGDAGGISIAEASSTASASTVGSVVLSKDGRTFTLTVKGHIFDVQLSSVEYADADGSFTRSGSHLYFSDLTDGQTVGIQAEIPEIIPNLQISWRNADGTCQSRLISESGKDGSLLLMDYKQPQKLNYVDASLLLPYENDLDGDGAKETVDLVQNQSTDSSDSIYALRVTDGGSTAQYQTRIISDPKLWLADIDYDGKMEMLISGNIMSDDYVAWCLRYQAGKLVSVPFADGGGGAQTETASVWIDGIGDGGISMGSAQYVLGTYGALRDYEYYDGAVQPVPGAVWTFTKNETWLTLKADLPAAYDDGQKTVVSAGSSILLTSTDGATWVRFVDKDNNTGTINIEKNTESWNFIIDGKSEDTYFEMLPYAG